MSEQEEALLQVMTRLADRLQKAVENFREIREEIQIALDAERSRIDDANEAEIERQEAQESVTPAPTA